MIAHVAARSISRQVKAWLDEGQSITRTISVFQSACNLVTDNDEIVALVTPDVGDGPFSVVLEGMADLRAIDSSAQVASAPGRFAVGRLEIDLETAAVWEPCPDWQALRTRSIVRSPLLSQGVSPGIEHLRAFCAYRAGHSVFATLLDAGAGEDTGPFANTGRKRHLSRPESALGAATVQRAAKALVDLCAGWEGDRHRLQDGAATLAGLGIFFWGKAQADKAKS